MSTTHIIRRTCDLCQLDIADGARYFRVEHRGVVSPSGTMSVDAVDICETCAEGTGIASMFAAKSAGSPS